MALKASKNIHVVTIVYLKTGGALDVYRPGCVALVHRAR